jgi:hypothetical protein
MMIRRYAGCCTTPRNARRPDVALSQGSAESRTALRMLRDASFSTASKTDSKSACLPPKWWYSAPLVTRAPATIWSRLVPAYPCSVNRSVATSTRARLVEAEYSWRRDGRFVFERSTLPGTPRVILRG